MVKIAPSLLAADFLNLSKEIQEIETAGADILHIDIMDGHFVPNLSFGFPIIKALKSIHKKPLDVHLMVTNPETYIDRLADLGAEYISVHQESTFHLHRLIYQIKDRGIKAGVVLNPATSAETIFPVIKDLDFVLLMSVNPGFGGQSFIPLVYDKIKKLKEEAKKQSTEIEIEIDGGVTDKNSAKLIESGADILVAGSYIFKNDDYAKAIRSLKCSEI